MRIAPAPTPQFRFRRLAPVCALLLAASWSSWRLDAQELPSAPEPAAPVTADSPIRLPRNYQQPWAVEQPRLLGKLAYGFSSTVSFRTFLEGGLIAGIPNLPSAPVQPNAPTDVTIASAEAYFNELASYRNAIHVWKHASEVILRDRQHRLEAGLATAETRDLLSNLVLPIALRQQARYVPANIDLPFEDRMSHALASVVVTRGDNGRLQPNYSKILGTVGAAVLGEEAYAPLFKADELGTSHFAFKYVGLSLAGDLATNVAHELVQTMVRPDIQMYNLHGRSLDDSYYPLSVGGKFLYWVQGTYQVRNFVQGVLTAGLPIIPREPTQPARPTNITSKAQLLALDQILVQYGDDIAGWRRYIENNFRYHERRLIGGVSESETQLFLERFAVPLVFQMDPRYIPLGREFSAGDRAGYALKSLVVGHTDGGNRFVNLPVLGGAIGAALIAKEYYYPTLGTPALATSTVLIRTITLNLAADAILNELSEFRRHRTY